jgi:hypothetical protein
VLSGCVGSKDERTRIAIDRYKAADTYSRGRITVETFFKKTNEFYKREMWLGCPKCGATKRFGIGLCRRCYRMQAAFKRVHVTTPCGFIFSVQQEFKAFAKGLEKRNDLLPSQKLRALLTWKPEKSQS